MTDATQQLAQLLRETGQAHHRAFAATNGADPAWPAWYAEYLVPRLRDLLGRSVPAAELARRLTEWHEAHSRSTSGEEWPEFYARGLAVLRNPGK